MSTEQLIRDYYNAMHSIHTQPGNVYDLGDHLHDLTVHKHLDQDPLTQFREAYPVSYTHLTLPTNREV